jgi:hypothetical protein
MTEWSRGVPKGTPYYEVSSKGDKRFSAYFARIKSLGGHTIEFLYQVGIKGYPSINEGKGQPPLNGAPRSVLYDKYKTLWVMYLNENPGLLEDLRVKSAGRILTDRFAKTEISQAKALAELLTDYERTLNAQEPTAPTI